MKESIQQLTTLLSTVSVDIASTGDYLLTVGKVLRRVEAEVTMRSAIVAWKEQRDIYPQFSNMSDEQASVTIRVLIRLIDRFLKTIRYEWNEDQRITAATDIFYRWKVWTMIDIVNFIKYVRTNPEGKPDKDFKIYPMSFSPLDLLRFSVMYEDCRARERETYDSEKLTQIQRGLPDAQAVVGEDGEKANLRVGAAIKLLAQKTEKGIKPQNTIEKERHKRDVAQMVIDSKKPVEQLAKEERERIQLVNRNTKKMFPGDEDKKKK